MSKRIPGVSVLKSAGGVMAVVIAGLVMLGWLFFLVVITVFGAPGGVVFALVVGVPLLLWWASRHSRSTAARRAEARYQQELAEWLAQFPEKLHEPLWRLVDQWQAALLWSSLGLGRLPDPRKADPGAWPTLLPWAGGDPPDSGAWPIPIGARVRLAALDGQSPKHFQNKLAELAMALDIPAARVHSSDGRQIVIDLKVTDPLAGTNVSGLLDDQTADRIRAAAAAASSPDELAQALTEACRDARLMVPVDGLSCTDDVHLMISEFGDSVTINLAKGGHGAVQGTTRSGKSITLNQLLASASLMDDVRIVVIDPNTAAVAPWWRTAYRVCDDADPDIAAAVLEETLEELKTRDKLFWTGRTDRVTRFSRETPLYLIVVDEVSEYSANPRFQRALKKLGAQAAKYGGRLYLAGQKLGGDELSSATKANLNDRICHRVESRHDFGHLYENTPELEARGLNAADETMPQGVAIVRVRSHPETMRARSVYLPTEACWVISDAIVAARGLVRPLPSDEPPAPTTRLASRDRRDTPEASTEPPVPKRSPVPPAPPQARPRVTRPHQPHQPHPRTRKPDTNPL